MTDGNRNAQRVLPERFSNNGVTDIGSMSWFNLGGHLSKSFFFQGSPRCPPLAYLHVVDMTQPSNYTPPNWYGASV